jgi:predicted Rossmann fold flavoprotein
MMTTYNTIIIGGGSSGILSSIELNDNKSILLEKNDIVGKKILITGGGRCNLTNNSPLENYVESYYNGGNFYRNAFNTFFNHDIIELLENNGCKTKIEENERVFPVSDKAKTVQKTLFKILNNSRTRYELKSNVTTVKKENDYFVVTYNKSKTIKSKYLILACGGNSYPKTGSNGDGYRFAKKLGHTTTEQMGGLAPIKTEEKWTNNLQGITVEVRIEIKADKKTLTKDRGSIIFTHNGISGPIILNNSMLIEKHLRKNKKVIINLDFCEKYSFEELNKKIQSDFVQNSNKSIKTYLHNYLPKRMSNEALNHMGIDNEKILNQITKKERAKLVEFLKRTPLVVSEVLQKESFVTNSGVKR